MKKPIALLIVALVVFLAIYRQRVFVRDPLATVTRDGLKVGSVPVMINYANDVLVQDRSSDADGLRVYLVEHWNMAVGTPALALKCIQGVACMTDADQATERAVVAGSRGRRPAFEGVTMTNKRVEFVDENGALVEVTLR